MFIDDVVNRSDRRDLPGSGADIVAVVAGDGIAWVKVPPISFVVVKTPSKFPTD